MDTWQKQGDKKNCACKREQERTFAVKAGYQFMNYTGEANASSADYDINEKMIYVNIGILFRSSGDFF